MANPRMRTVSRHYQPRAVRLAVYEQARDSGVFDQRRLDQSAGTRRHTRSCRSSLKQRMVQSLPPLGAASDGPAGDLREATVGSLIPEMVANAIERRTAHRLRQAQPVQNGHTGWHQAFTAWLFPRKPRTLEKFDDQATSSKQNRQRGTRDAAPGDKHIHHALLTFAGAPFAAHGPLIRARWDSTAARFGVSLPWSPDTSDRLTGFALPLRDAGAEPTG